MVKEKERTKETERERESKSPNLNNTIVTPRSIYKTQLNKIN